MVLSYAHDEKQSRRRLSAIGVSKLAGVGATVGAVVGTGLLYVLQIGSPGGLSLIDIPFSITFGGGFGAIVGAVAAPLVGWGLLRHLTVGQAIRGTLIGTLIGAIAATVINGHTAIGGCLGFLAAAMMLRLRYRPEKND